MRNSDLLLPLPAASRFFKIFNKKNFMKFEQISKSLLGMSTVLGSDKFSNILLVFYETTPSGLVKHV
jgi:hypothetical protein